MAQRRISSIADGHQLGVGAQPGELVGIGQQRVHAVRGRVAGGLVAGDDEQQDEHVELGLGELVAVDLAVDELGDDVVAGLVGPLGPQLGRVHVELGRRRGAVVGADLLLVLRVVRTDEPVRPVEEHVPLFLGDAHDVGDGLERQLGRHLGHEVARAALDDAVDDELGAVAEVLLDEADHPRA